jgi:hypothetical protein
VRRLSRIFCRRISGIYQVYAYPARGILDFDGGIFLTGIGLKYCVGRQSDARLRSKDARKKPGFDCRKGKKIDLELEVQYELSGM